MTKRSIITTDKDGDPIILMKRYIAKGRTQQQQKDVVCSNAAIAISTSKGISLTDAFNLARESIDSKNALQSFETLKKINQ